MTNRIQQLWPDCCRQDIQAILPKMLMLKIKWRENRGVNFSLLHNLCSSTMYRISFLGRSVGGGPMRSRRNIDTSPYGSNNNAYLSPPQESSWRRTSSDSAIHQSLTQAQV